MCIIYHSHIQYLIILTCEPARQRNLFQNSKSLDLMRVNHQQTKCVKGLTISYLRLKGQGRREQESLMHPHAVGKGCQLLSRTTLKKVPHVVRKFQGQKCENHGEKVLVSPLWIEPITVYEIEAI